MPLPQLHALLPHITFLRDNAGMGLYDFFKHYQKSTTLAAVISGSGGGGAAAAVISSSSLSPF